MKKQLTNNKTKKISTVAMLLAIAVILGAFSLRIGAGIKISFKFLPVFTASVLFGPLYGGLCGILSDIISYFFNPGVGAYMPQIGIVEGLYGVSFGLFFYNSKGINIKNIIKLTACLLLNTSLLSIALMSYFLKDLMGMTYINMIIFRVPSSAINFIFHYIGILIMLKLIPHLKELIKI